MEITDDGFDVPVPFEPRMATATVAIRILRHLGSSTDTYTLIVLHVFCRGDFLSGQFE
jgi:hypothetical protein